MIREKVIEKCLVDQVKRCSGKAPKFSSPANRGVPDRLVLLPGRPVAFVECKASKGRLSRLQEKWVSELKAMGYIAEVVDSFEGVDAFMERMLCESH